MRWRQLKKSREIKNELDFWRQKSRTLKLVEPPPPSGDATCQFKKKYRITIKVGYEAVALVGG